MRLGEHSKDNQEKFQEQQCERIFGPAKEQAQASISQWRLTVLELKLGWEKLTNKYGEFFSFAEPELEKL